MGLMARLKSMWRRHDERLVEEGLEARAAGVGGDKLSLAPGQGRVSEGGSLPLLLEHGPLLSDDEAAEDEAAEDEEPEGQIPLA
jgi:hypothetical protein